MKKGTLLGAFFACWQAERRLTSFQRVHKRLDLEDGLSWVGVGVDGDCFGLVVLLSFRVEFDFNLSTGAGCDWLLGTLRHRTSARTFALVQDEGSLPVLVNVKMCVTASPSSKVPKSCSYVSKTMDVVGPAGS